MRGEERVDPAEVFLAAGRAREHDGERLLLVRRIEQDAEQVEDLLGRARPAWKHDDAVAGAHERLEPLLDVRQDHELVHDRVGRLGRHDAGLGEPDVAPVVDALLRVTDRRALHRPLHGAGSAARADVQAPQPELVADSLGVVVLLAADRVPAPAHDDVRPHPRPQHAGVAQDAIDGVRDALRVLELDAAVLVDLAVDVQDVAQHREQVLLDAADHPAVDEGPGRGVAQLELHAPGLAHDADVEVVVALEDHARVVGLAAGVQHGERAATIGRVEAAPGRVEQSIHFLLRQVLEAAGRRDAGIDGDGLVGAGDRHLDAAHHGRITISVPGCVRSQMSTMSELLTAMQPLVQS